MNKKAFFIYRKKRHWLAGVLATLVCYSCVPTREVREAQPSLPEAYQNNFQEDTLNTAIIPWQDFFKDEHLNNLIDSALDNNQELYMTLQELKIAQNEVQIRKGEYLPSVGIKAGAGLEKSARYTRAGAVEENLEVEGEEFPDPLPDYMVGLQAKWEVDIWNKLRTAKKAAVLRYLSTVQGKNFMVTNLIAEIANSYYELLALDNQLEIVQQNIEIQSNALRIVKLQKEAARVTELAVSKFQAEVLHTRSLQYDIRQNIVETENRINYLVGRYPQPVARDPLAFTAYVPKNLQAGLPSQLLQNRPDIKQAELDLAASKLDVKVAKARFYPSLDLSANLGYQAFNAKYLLNTPESLLYSIAGDIAAPLINRKAIKAEYSSANAEQIKAVYNYEQTILNAYIEVSNQLSKITNLEKSYELKAEEVEQLNRSIKISNNLFRSARADYMEVLLTQRDALESKFDLVETKMQQMNAVVNMYQALGGGWN